MEQLTFILGTNAMTIVMAFCGIGFLMGRQRTDDSDLDRAFNKARAWMATTSFLLCAEALVHKFVLGPDASMFDLQLLVVFCAYLFTRMGAFGLSPSFDRTFISPGRVSWVMTRILLLGALLLVLRFLDMSSRLRLALIIVSVIWIAADTTWMVVYVIHSYLVARKAFEEFYAEDFDHYLRWTPVMLVILSVYAFSWSLVLFAPLAVQGLYSFFGAALWFYLFMYYERHTIYFRYRKSDTLVRIPEPIEAAPESALLLQDRAEIPAKEMEEHYNTFLAGLAGWIDAKGYCEPDITVESLARMFASNRTYLSSFINAHYGMSFRQWIATLRIADAKELLRSSSLKEQEIADTLGFASLPSFIRTFTKMENMSPSAYRKLHGHDAD